jgi:hypothetical protein
MGRQIVTARDVQKQAETEAAGGKLAAGGKVRQKVPDNFGEVLLKSIPAEIVAAYITIANAVAGGSGVPSWLLWAVIGILAAVTPVYLTKLQGVTKLSQRVVSTVSFLVWVLSLGEPQNPALALGWKPVYGAALLPVYAILVRLFLYDKPSQQP